jgi:hypothetical protein
LNSSLERRVTEMKDWFVRVELDATATEGQAMTFAEHLGSTLVDANRSRTEVRVYVAAASARQAISDSLERVNAVALKAGFGGKAVQIEAKTEADRVAELVSQGIPEIVGVAEIKEVLEVRTRQQVGQLAERDDFPRPVAELKAGRIWLRSDIEEFRRRWRRTSGRTASA